MIQRWSKVQIRQRSARLQIETRHANRPLEAVTYSMDKATYNFLQVYSPDFESNKPDEHGISLQHLWSRTNSVL